jgi:hypothetical protein
MKRDLHSEVGDEGLKVSVAFLISRGVSGKSTPDVLPMRGSPAPKHILINYFKEMTFSSPFFFIQIS